MAGHARRTAELASFQAFINGYLREIDAGRLWLVRHWREANPTVEINLQQEQLIELALPSQQCNIVLELSYRSLVGCHGVTAVYSSRGQQWQCEGFWSALLLLVQEIYSGKKIPLAGPVGARQLELTHRLADSLQNMIHYMEHALEEQNSASDFIAAEQSLVCGHWLHPTPKSRQGILDWQHSLFAPEMRAEFQLHYFAVDRTLVQCEAADQHPDPQTISLAAADWPLEILQENEILIPAHPLQAQWLLARADLQTWFERGYIRSLGSLGIRFSATSSVRTVFQRQFPWMFKFSVPVKITNSFRQNKRHELAAGAMMSRLYRTLGFAHLYPQFQMIEDPAFITVDLPDKTESGFEVIIRRNPFYERSEQGKVTLAALLQDDWSAGEGGQSSGSSLQKIIQQIARKEQRHELAVAQEWFDRYWVCSIEPLLMLLDKWGIGLEAHQQNSLVDVEQGYPTAYFYRDNQGFYLAESARGKLLARLPELGECAELFYQRDMMLDRFTYYLIVNHLFALIYRLGRDGYADEFHWNGVARTKLRQLQPRLHDLGREFVERLLERETLPSKANLLTRVHDIDELEAEMEMAVYVAVPNPLQLPAKARPRAAEVAYA